MLPITKATLWIYIIAGMGVTMATILIIFLLWTWWKGRK